ncbi:MAG: hypothetical protein QXU67_03770, partial [Candidatus Bathyarchaeia archaeon]
LDGQPDFIGYLGNGEYLVVWDTGPVYYGYTRDFKTIVLDPRNPAKWQQSPGGRGLVSPWREGNKLYLFTGRYVQIMELPGKRGGPARFMIHNLRIVPAETEVQWQPIHIYVRITNVGEEEGSGTIELKVNGTTVDAKTVTLAGGKSTTVMFKLIEKVGTFVVEVDGLKGIFVVKPPWTLYGTIATVAIVTLGAVTLHFRRRKSFCPNH